MAVTTTKRANGGISIPPISSHPGYARAAQMLAALRAKLRTNDLRLQLLEFERYLSPRLGQQLSARDQEIAAQAAGLRAELAQREPTAGPSSQSDTDPVISAGLSVVNGAPLPPQNDSQAETERLNRENDILGAAIARQQANVDELKAALSLRIAEQLREHHDRLLRDLAAGAETLARATAAERAFGLALTEAGYSRRFDVLPVPPLRAPLILGDEHNYHSELSQLRRWMTARGLT